MFGKIPDPLPIPTFRKSTESNFHAKKLANNDRKYMTGPAKTGHIYTKYRCSENSPFLDLCLGYSCSVNFFCFLMDLSIRHIKSSS